MVGFTCIEIAVREVLSVIQHQAIIQLGTISFITINIKGQIKQFQCQVGMGIVVIVTMMVDIRYRTQVQPIIEILQ